MADRFCLATLLIERFVQDHGNYPRALVLSAWGTANMRTGGDDIAQALRYGRTAEMGWCLPTCHGF